MKVGGLNIGKRNTWLQILGWGAFWILIPYILTEGQIPFQLTIRTLVTLAGIAIVVALNLEGLLPLFFYKKKYVWYALSGLGLLALAIFIVEWDAMPWAEYFHKPRFGRWEPSSPRSENWENARIHRRIFIRRGYYISLAMPFFTSLIGSSLIEIANYANKQAKENIINKKEKLEAELKFLKSQINPHFLFNALNNVYALSVIQSRNTPDTILKLSDMLRYMLYDCKADRVPLQKEIEYIRNYIGLVKLKDSRGLNISTSLDVSQPEVLIAPLLFVPFIENAFKHSKIEDIETGWVKLSLQTTDKTVDFHISNSIPESGFTKDMTGGIGMQNVKRQLELLYPEKHRLSVNDTNGQFDVMLSIELDG